MSILFITHDFGVVARLCDRVAVMYGGFVVESGSVEQIFYNAAHPYTQALLCAIPRPEDSGGEPLSALEGDPIDLIRLPEGCAFAPRCPRFREECQRIRPEITDLGDGHTAACHLIREGGDNCHV